MSFAVPAAWILLAIAIPIIALYVLRVRLRRVKVSTNLFWKQVYEEKPPRAWWKNLRHLLSLLAQLLILVLLVTAVADPFLVWQTKQARRIILVIDTSASMSAQDIRPSRFQAARTAAHQVLDGLRLSDEVAIIAAGSRPEVVLGMAGHTPTLRRALDSLEVSDNLGSLPDAVQLAGRLIGQHPAGEILVFSDGCHAIDETLAQSLVAATASVETQESPSSDPEPVPSPKLRFFNFSTAADNVGITQFQARRSLVDPMGYQVLLSVKNHSALPVNGRVELTLDDVPIDVLPIKLQAGELWTRTIDKTSREGGILQAALTELARPPTDEDASGELATQTAIVPGKNTVNFLTTDDRAWALVPPRKVQNVLIVTPGNLFLHKVFEANPLVNVTVTADFPSVWPRDTVIVLHRRMPETIPNGSVLVIDPESSTNLWTLGDLIENPIVTEQDSQSTLMTHIRLDNVLLPEARRLEFLQPHRSLASTLDGTSVFATVPSPGGSGGQCLVLAVSLERSDLAFRTAFPILVTNALTWFAGQAGEVERSWSAGQITQLSPDRLPAGESPLILRSPRGTETILASSQIGPLNEVGIWRVEQALATANENRSSRLPERTRIDSIAVNLGSVDESDLHPRQAMEDTEESTSSTLAIMTWLSRPLWFYLATLTMVFVVVEWALYQRRWIS